jgi:hypothetical protein
MAFRPNNCPAGTRTMRPSAASLSKSHADYRTCIPMLTSVAPGSRSRQLKGS